MFAVFDDDGASFAANKEMGRHDKKPLQESEKKALQDTKKDTVMGGLRECNRLTAAQLALLFWDLAVPVLGRYLYVCVFIHMSDFSYMSITHMYAYVYM